jgi:pSer/pThr/pTyr-binding forkhead associated (FHA) protein
VHTYLAGTLAGAGSFRCRTCGFHVSLRALDEVPECPNCGDDEFARASMFDTSDPEAREHPAEDDSDWIEAVRESIDTDGQYLVFKDGDRVSVMPLTREWTKIGRSLTADIRLDDPTVSRRHALICCQPEAVRVLDDRSLNGIFLNGEHSEWGDLTDGDELLIGRYRLHFIERSESSSETSTGSGTITATR